MSPKWFEGLLAMVAHSFQKTTHTLQKVHFCGRNTWLNYSFPCHKRCPAITEFSYWLGKCKIRNIISETCEVICQCLRKDYLNSPRTPEESQKIQTNIKKIGTYQNVICPIKGKHIRIECSILSGIEYYNYRGF